MRKESKRSNVNDVISCVSHYHTIRIECLLNCFVPIQLLESRHVHKGIERNNSVCVHHELRVTYKAHRTFNLCPRRIEQVIQAYHSIRIALRIKWEVLQVSDVISCYDIDITTIRKGFAERIGSYISSPYRSKRSFLRILRLQNYFPQNCIGSIELLPKAVLFAVFKVLRIYEGHRKRSLDNRRINIALLTLYLQGQALNNRTYFNGCGSAIFFVNLKSECSSVLLRYILVIS